MTRCFRLVVLGPVMKRTNPNFSEKTWWEVLLDSLQKGLVQTRTVISPVVLYDAIILIVYDQIRRCSSDSDSYSGFLLLVREVLAATVGSLGAVLGVCCFDSNFKIAVDKKEGITNRFAGCKSGT